MLANVPFKGLYIARNTNLRQGKMYRIQFLLYLLFTPIVGWTLRHYGYSGSIAWGIVCASGPIAVLLTYMLRVEEADRVSMGTGKIVRPDD
ncbi:hypothetical protein KW790_02995 [Candidatus Parcubacteria bacterium]|nr:hypothetical protein [Candidatus Parcubacteria bacterium]